MHLHPLGVAIGVGVSFLVLGIITLLGWGLLAVLGVEDPATTAIIVGAPVGAVAGGWLAGRTAFRAVFHGAFTGVVFAGLVILLSVLDGSPAPAMTMVGFLVGGGVLGAAGGWLALRRRGGARTPTS
ncbi:MAG: hypothetical protein AB1Z57_10375 [Acidimicrobiia bacterium]